MAAGAADSRREKRAGRDIQGPMNDDWCMKMSNTITQRRAKTPAMRGAGWLAFACTFAYAFGTAGAQEASLRVEERDASQAEQRAANEPEPASMEDSRDGWRFTLAPYFWASSIRSEISDGRSSATTEACFSELLKDLDLAGQLRFEGLRNNRWGFYLDGTYLQLGDDSTVRVGRFRLRGIDFETEITQAWLDFGGMYRFGKLGRSFDIMLGGRYVHLATEVSAGSLLDRDNSEDTVSPVVGGRLEWSLTDRWILSVRGDVGGFGVDDAADVVWGATGLVGYRLNERATLGFGYRYYDIGTSGGDVDVDVVYHGPIVGVAFHF